MRITALATVDVKHDKEQLSLCTVSSRRVGMHDLQLILIETADAFCSSGLRLYGAHSLRKHREVWARRHS